MKESEFLRLKKEVEEARSRAEQAKGAMSQIRNQLEEEFGCSSVEDAEKLLEDMETKVREMSKRFEILLQDYREKWNGQLAERGI